MLIERAERTSIVQDLGKEQKTFGIYSRPLPSFATSANPPLLFFLLHVFSEPRIDRISWSPSPFAGLPVLYLHLFCYCWCELAEKIHQHPGIASLILLGPPVFPLRPRDSPHDSPPHPPPLLFGIDSANPLVAIELTPRSGSGAIDIASRSQSLVQSTGQTPSL